VNQIAVRILSRWREGVVPDPILKVWEWADQYRVLPSVGGAEPGPYRTDRTPYLREIMERLSPYDPCRELVVMKASQVGATECMANWIGYIAHKLPAPTIMLQPTVEAAKRYSKQRLAPTIRETPILREIINDVNPRDSGNTIMEKEFPGGMLMLTGANSPVGLASTPAKNLCLDEVDRYPGDVGGEGDPVKIITARTTTFPDRKIFKTSTPTIAGASRIEREWKRSDQRYYHVPCPFCGAMQPLKFERLAWDKDVDGKHLPETTKYLCLHCATPIDERYKTDMLAAGQWVPSKPESKLPGYHINGLMRPIGWKGWVEIAADFLEAKDDPLLLQVFVNTELGEVWEEQGERPSSEPLMARREKYGPEVPMLAGVLTLGIDVQDDRLELLWVAWGAKHESWTMEWKQLHGDPAKLELWDRLEAEIARPWQHACGEEMKIVLGCIDTGGHHTDAAYRFVRMCRQKKIPIAATKGSSEPLKPLVSRPTTTNIARIPLFPVGTIVAKDAVYGRLRNEEPGPAYMHFPETVDEEFFRQLTAEKVVTRIKNNVGVRHYLKVYRHNEVLDMAVLNLVALAISNPNIQKRIEHYQTVKPEDLKRKAEAVQPKVTPELSPFEQAAEGAPRAKQMRHPRPRGGWVNSWRG
jgi:phage terminase large subunit GpA-like protein